MLNIPELTASLVDTGSVQVFIVIPTLSEPWVAAGTVIANASATIVLPIGTTFEVVSCDLPSPTTDGGVGPTLLYECIAASLFLLPFGSTEGFTVTPGSFTVNLVCNGVGSVFLRNVSLTAFFVAGS